MSFHGIFLLLADFTRAFKTYLHRAALILEEGICQKWNKGLWKIVIYAIIINCGSPRSYYSGYYSGSLLTDRCQPEYRACEQVTTVVVM
jgi:hypothetical protein